MGNVRLPSTFVAMKALIIITLLVAAGQLRGQAAGVQRPLQSARPDTVSALAATRASATTAAADDRAHHIRVGALTGAVIGAALGAFAGANVPVGCEAVGNCHKPHARLSAVVGLGSMGAVAGAIVGTIIGAVVPSGAPTRAAGSNRPAS